MDIYSFIPSRDIAAHCRTLEHSFTPLEHAAIIYHSKKPLAERYKAWKEIIDTLPDMKVISNPGEKHEQTLFESLHQFLTDYMRIETSLAERFINHEPDTIYTFTALYNTKNPYFLGNSRDSDYDNTPYSTLDAVMNAIKEDTEYEHEYGSHCNTEYVVYKRRLDDYDKYISAQVTPNGEYMGISYWELLFAEIEIYRWDGSWAEEEALLEESDANIFSAFNDINVYIPIPFRKGDILAYKYRNHCPLVLRSDEWKYGLAKYPDGRLYRAEGSIMDTVLSYVMTGNGTVYNNFSPAELNIEYYRGELTGFNRALLAISNHMKGELSIDLMLNAYDIILQEERLKMCEGDLQMYTQKGLALAGLEHIKQHPGKSFIISSSS